MGFGRNTRFDITNRVEETDISTYCGHLARVECKIDILRRDVEKCSLLMDREGGKACVENDAAVAIVVARSKQHRLRNQHQYLKRSIHLQS